MLLKCSQQLHVQIVPKYLLAKPYHVCSFQLETMNETEG